MKIAIKNFRNIRNLTIDGAPLALFGMNRAGKSSVLYAIQYALYGWCAQTGRDGRGASAMIRSGAKSASIEITFGDVVVHCEITAKKNEWFVTDMAGTGIDHITSRAAFWQHLGCDLRSAEIAGNPAAYVLSKDLGDALASHVAGDIAQSELATYCGPRWEWVREFAVRKNCGELRDAAAIKSLGKACYEWRTAINRDLKQARAALAETPRPETQADPAKSSAYAATMAKLDERLAALNREHGAAETARDADVVAAELDAARVGLDAATTALRSATERQLAAHAENDAASQRLREAQVNESTAQLMTAQAESRAVEAQRAIDAVNADAKCPTCGREWTQKIRDAVTAPLQAALEAAQDDVSQRVSAKDAAFESLKLANHAASAARETIDAAAGRATTATAEFARARARVDALETEAKMLRRPLAVIDAEIDDITARRNNGAKIIEAARVLKQIAEWEAFIATNEGEVETLDWAVEEFHNGAAIKTLVEGKINAFTARINAELSRHELSARIDVDGKSVVLMLRNERDAETGYQPASATNRGTQRLACLAIARAFAAGSPVILDDVNDLDWQDRRDVISGLAGITDEIVIACATPSQTMDLDKLGGAMIGVAVYELSAGTSRRCGE